MLRKAGIVLHTDRDRSNETPTFLNNVCLLIMIIKNELIINYFICCLVGFWFRFINVITFKRFYYIITASASITFKSIDRKCHVL